MICQGQQPDLTYLEPNSLEKFPVRMNQMVKYLVSTIEAW